MSPVQALADAAAAMVSDDDVTDTLARLVTDCAQLISADAVGLMVRTRGGGLELLSSTSHDDHELEIYEHQCRIGPCLEVLRTGAQVILMSGDDIRARWSETGSVIVSAGYGATHASPLRWRGRIVGALNAFHERSSQISSEGLLLAQAFADVATVTIVGPPVDADDINARIDRALQGRTIIEQAKGVLAYRRRVGMADAYELLVKLAAERQSSLTVTARSVIAEASRKS